MELDLVFWDTTSTYFEGSGPEDLAKYGFSKNKRPDRLQIVIGVLMTKEGIPVAHQIFPGNTNDTKTFKSIVDDLRKRFSITRVIMVGDRGMVSQKILKELRECGMEYIVGMRMRRLARKSMVAKLEQKLLKGGTKSLVGNRGYRRYLNVNGKAATINREALKREERFDGKYLLLTNSDLPTEQVALAYKDLWKVERAFRELKSGLDLRPYLSLD